MKQPQTVTFSLKNAANEYNTSKDFSKEEEVDVKLNDSLIEASFSDDYLNQ